MKKLLHIFFLLLLPTLALAQEQAETKPLKYLGDYVRRDNLYIMDGHIVHPDSVFSIKVADVERVEVHGRGMHPYPELKYMLNGKPISQDAAGDIVVDDIIWMKFIDELTLSIITDPKLVLYVVDGRATSPDSLPSWEEIVSIRNIDIAETNLYP